MTTGVVGVEDTVVSFSFSQFVCMSHFHIHDGGKLSFCFNPLWPFAGKQEAMISILYLNIEIYQSDFSGGPVAKTTFPMQGASGLIPSRTTKIQLQLDMIQLLQLQQLRYAATKSQHNQENKFFLIINKSTI